MSIKPLFFPDHPSRTGNDVGQVPTHEYSRPPPSPRVGGKTPSCVTHHRTDIPKWRTPFCTSARSHPQRRLQTHSITTLLLPDETTIPERLTMPKANSPSGSRDSTAGPAQGTLKRNQVHIFRSTPSPGLSTCGLPGRNPFFHCTLLSRRHVTNVGSGNW